MEHLVKKCKAVSPISILNLGIIQDSVSASDSEAYTKLRATSVNTAKMSVVKSDMAVISVVSMNNESTVQKFQN